MQAEQLNTKLVTPEIVCSYPHLAEKTEDLSGRLAYTLSIPLPKSDTKAQAMLQQVMSNAAVNAWGPKFAGLAGVRHYVVEGDPEDAVYKDCVRFTAKAPKRQPGCVFPNMEPVPVERIDEVFYPGAIIRASVTAYGTDTGGGKTIAFSLNNVMFVRDGERIGRGASAPNDDFGAFKDSSFSDDPFRGQQQTDDLFA